MMMDARMRWRRLRILAAAAVLAAVPADAQPGSYGLSADSLGLAGDAVPLPVERVRTECDPIGLRVARDTAELSKVQHFRGCEASEFPALGRDLYVHVLMGGDCGAQFGVEAYRSDSRREYRVVMVARFGGCRAGRTDSWWIRLPPLPEGWTVAFTNRGLDRDDLPLDMDSRGAPPDAVPLAIQREEMECRAQGFSVVRDRADTRDLRRFPGCEPSAFPGLGRDLYVRVP